MIAFLLSPLGKMLMAGVAVLALLTSVYVKGRGDQHTSDKKAEDARTAAAEARVAKLNASLATATTKAAQGASEAKQKIVYQTQTVIKRVPYEIPRGSDVQLPLGFLRLYNASLGLPADAGPAAGAVGSTGSLYSADAFSTVIGPNNGQCLAQADQLNRLISFYEETRATMNKSH